MIVNDLLDKQYKKRTETGYIEELSTKFQKPFAKQADQGTISYIDAYAGGKNSSLFFIQAKQKNRTRSIQKQGSHTNYHLLSRLSRMYTLSNYSRLLHFFGENRYLIPVVVEAHEELKKRFPSEELLLEVVSDPEADGCDELFAYILTSLSVEDALQRLNDLDEQWFLNQLDSTNGLFNFNLRFI